MFKAIRTIKKNQTTSESNARRKRSISTYARPRFGS